MSKTYDPSKNIVNVAGITITGFMKGTSIRVKRTTPKWSSEVGMQGDCVYVKSLDDTAVLEVTLQATSPSNTDLSKLYKKDLKDNTGKGAVSVEDLNTESSLFSSAEGRILNCPDYERGDSLTPVVWEIHMSKLSESFHDGAIG